MSTHWHRFLDYEARLVGAGLIEKRKPKPKKKRKYTKRRPKTDFAERAIVELVDFEYDWDEVSTETDQVMKLLEEGGEAPEDLQDFHPYFSPWLRAAMGALIGWNIKPGFFARNGAIRLLESVGILHDRWYASTVVSLKGDMDFDTISEDVVKKWTHAKLPADCPYHVKHNMWRYHSDCCDHITKLNNLVNREDVYIQRLDKGKIRIWMPLQDMVESGKHWTSSAHIDTLVELHKPMPAIFRKYGWENIITVHDNEGVLDETIKLVCAISYLPTQGPHSNRNSLPLDPRGREKTRLEKADAEAKRKADLLKKLW